MAEDITRGLTSERITELAFAFKKSSTLLTAIDLDLFTHLSSGAHTVEKLAGATGLEPEKIDRIVTVCKTLGLLRDLDGRLENASDVERYLVSSRKGFLGDYYRTSARRDYATWADLTGHLTGTVEDVADHSDYVRMMGDAERARRFTESGYQGAIGLAYRLVKFFDFSRHERWLDFAGGSGVYSIAACERTPGLSATVMDQPNVIRMAEEYIAAKSLGERIDVRSGNFLDAADYPGGYDLISFITPLQGYMPETVKRVFGYTFSALEAGGEILVIDYMLNDDKTGPLDPALASLFTVRGGHCRGRVNTGSEFKEYLQSAGFKHVEIRWFTEHQLGMATGRKPV